MEPPVHITSREYKVIVDVGLFTNEQAACRSIISDLEDVAQMHGCKVAGDFDPAPKERTIVFLDTPDFSLRANGWLLRQRIRRRNGATEYTLKCRSEDRYIANGQDLAPAKGLKHEQKFEEDIGVPFVSRFSSSSSVSLGEKHAFAGDNLPETLADAGKLFPVLRSLRRDDLKCEPKTRLQIVNGLQAFERVFTGPVVHLPQAAANVALILWQKGKKGRLLTAEFSFRYGNKRERFSAKLARAARGVFEGVQRCDWTRPDALTKTQYMYGA